MSHMYSEDTKIFKRSFYPLYQQTEQNETPAHSKQISKTSHSLSLPAVDTVGSSTARRLANLVEQNDDTRSIHTKGTLSEAFKSISFHYPRENFFPAKSLKQKIGVLRPANLNPMITEGEEKNINKALSNNRTQVDSFYRSSNSPPKDTHFHGRKTALSPPKDSLQQRLKQMSTIYRNHSVLNQLRRNHAGANNLRPRLDAYSSQTPQNHLLPSTQSHKAAWDLSNRASMPDLNETPQKGKDPFRDQSFGGSQWKDKTMSLHYRKRCDTSFQSPIKDSFELPDMFNSIKSQNKSRSLSFTSVNRSLNISFQANTKDIHLNSTNKVSKEKTHTTAEIAEAKSSKAEGYSREADYTDLMESKLENILSNKSAEPARFAEINGLFDSFIEIMRENQGVVGIQKVRSLLRKTKLAYEVFFQNYTQHQNMKLSQEQDYQKRLEKECEDLDAKIDEMETEIENLRKENEKLALKNQLLKNSATLSLSLSTVNQQHNGDSGEPAIESESENKQLSQIEALKLIITEQQNAIFSMQKKETKLVKLLYACKQRGLDIEQIYYEDLKNTSHNFSGLQESDHDSEVIDNYSAKHQDHPNVEHNHQEENQALGNGISGKEHTDSKSATDSELTESYPDYDFDESQNKKEFKPKIDPTLQNVLRLDFSRLNQPYKKPTQEVSQQYKMSHPENMLKNPIESKMPSPNLAVEGQKKGQEEQKTVGFHQEFMSKLNEFSPSWRQAAMKERKTP